VIVVALKMMSFFVFLALGMAPKASLWGRVWHQGLVVPLARRLSKITRGHVLLMVGIGGFLAFVIWLVGAEGLHISAMALPELTTWAMMFEISTLLDAIAAVMIVSAVGRVRVGVALAVERLCKCLGTVLRRAGRARKKPAARSGPANDDDGPADGRWPDVQRQAA